MGVTHHLGILRTAPRYHGLVSLLMRNVVHKVDTQRLHVTAFSSLFQLIMYIYISILFVNGSLLLRCVAKLFGSWKLLMTCDLCLTQAALTNLFY